MSDALKLAERLRNLAAPQPAAPQAVNPLDALLTQIINRRVVVEQQLFDMAAGKLPMPDKDKLRELAVYLGTPSSQPTVPAPAQAVPALDERKAFETWAESQFGPILRDPKLEYTYTDVRSGWRAWQARAKLPAQAVPLTDAARDVLAERWRQISSEVWTESHDDNEHEPGVLASAAACYALNASSWLKHGTTDSRVLYKELSPSNRNWPWDEKWWQPKDERRDLVRAGALILAELERIDRANGIKQPGSEAC